MKAELIHWNSLNAVLIVLVAIPPIAMMWYLNSSCGTASEHFQPWTAYFCGWYMESPLSFLNFLFFLAVSLTFYIISLIQKSTWLIDPYWTLIPVMIAHYFQFHPKNLSDPLRSVVSLALIWAWSIRLTHSYFRREEWQFGAREDWRYSMIAKQFPDQWWWISFIVVYVFQQGLLIGICLPFYAIFTSNAPWQGLDSIACALGIIAITIGYFADTQLYQFMKENEHKVPRTPILDTGLWYYSRHPNYFGEQLFWWSMGLLAYNAGQAWMLMGAASNSACLGIVTVMVERRMRLRTERKKQMDLYCSTTSILVPWFKWRPPKVAKE